MIGAKKMIEVRILQLLTWADIEDRDAFALTQLRDHQMEKGFEGLAQGCRDRAALNRHLADYLENFSKQRLPGVFI